MAELNLNINFNETITLGEYLEDIKKKRYQTTRRLGSGTYGVVYHATDSKDNIDKAIKMIRKRTMPKDNFITAKNEAELIIKYESPYIVKGYDFFVEEVHGSRHVCIITEYCPDGDLEIYLGKLKIENKQIDNKTQILWARYLIAALKFLRSQHIIHRDIKPGNIMIKNDERRGYVLKLTDFGLARQFEDSLQKTSSHVGTAKYGAPELEDSNKDNPYDYKVDIWPIGCVIYEICTLNYLFSPEVDLLNILFIRKSIRNNPIKKLPNEHLLQPILDKILIRNPKDRAEIEELFNMIAEVSQKAEVIE